MNVSVSKLNKISATLNPNSYALGYYGNIIEYRKINLYVYIERTFSINVNNAL